LPREGGRERETLIRRERVLVDDRRAPRADLGKAEEERDAEVERGEKASE
jgi:hypothetical protein